MYTHAPSVTESLAEENLSIYMALTQSSWETEIQSKLEIIMLSC